MGPRPKIGPPLGLMTLFILHLKSYLNSRKKQTAEVKIMITNKENVIFTQITKKRKLDREFAWISREFKDFHTLSDIEINNVERYAALHLGYQF